MRDGGIYSATLQLTIDDERRVIGGEILRARELQNTDPLEALGKWLRENRPDILAAGCMPEDE